MALSADEVSRLIRFIERFENGELAQALDHYNVDGRDLPVVDELASFISSSSICSRFDWPAWQRSLEGDPFSPATVEHADLEMMRRLLTYAVRLDRFSGGSFAKRCSNGSIERALKRLSVVIDGESQG